MRFKLPKGFPKLIKTYRAPRFSSPKMGSGKAPKIYKMPKMPKFR